MQDQTVFSRGDYIVDYSRLYVVSEIKYQNNLAGKLKKYLYYQPVFKIDRDQGVVSGLPEENVVKAGFRRVLTKDGVKKIIADIKRIKALEVVDYKEYKELIFSNDPMVLIPLLKSLWVKKKQTSEKVLGRVDNEIASTILDHLTEEFAFVTKRPAKDIRKEIEKELDAATKQAEVGQ
ncbi:MAG: hypothetical protein WC686_00385 [Candidatus Shapirobacteria bacterium]|jgi:RNA polymerase-interacting CarD/CdnL/TRCF family regulator